MRRPVLVLLALAVTLVTPLAAAAVVKTPHAQAELVADVDAVAPGRAFTVALRLEAIPHWHTYWRNPGDSGLPTRITWTLPQGFEAGAIEWPLPRRIPVGPLANYGYEDEVILPTRIVPPSSRPASELPIRARADYLICEKVCVPESVDLALDLRTTTGDPPASGWARAIAAARESMPRPLPGLAAHAYRGERAIELVVRPPAAGEAPAVAAAFFLPYEESLIQPPASQPLATGADGLRLRLALADNAPAVERLAGVLVVEPALGGREAIEIDAVVSPGPAAPEGGATTFSDGSRLPALVAAPGAASSGQGPWSAFLGGSSGTSVPGIASPAGAGLTLALALVFALAGGLVLNLMPCVFPVLSLKTLRFAANAHEDRSFLRQEGALFMAGVVATFWALAALLLALRAGGEQVGWGFQLQSPVVVAALAVLFLLLALNLFGVFELGFSLQDLAGRVARPATSARREAFLTGVLAVVVASPCTAPFLGAAMGFTLAQPAPVTLLVFTAMALGVALPVTLLAFFPAWLRRLPRPGPWMETLKQAMAFPLLGTVVWLAWVLGQQAGNDAVMHLLAGMTVIAFAAWLYGRAQGGRGAVPSLAGAALALAAGLWLAWPAGEGPEQATPVAAGTDTGRAPVPGSWQPWSEERVRASLARGQPVFVDFTAAWCISCQVNKRIALQDDDVMAAFEARGIALLRADWTRRDPAVTQGLAALGRNAVPVYALYVPGAGPRLLPQVLTPAIVLDALRSLPPARAAALGRGN